MVAPVFAWDTETWLIGPKLQSPPIVCLTYCLDGDESKIVHAGAHGVQDFMAEVLRTCVLVGHNNSYDMAALCAMWPALTPLVFQAYAEDRVTCTETRQKLIDIAKGRAKGEKKLAYDLASVSMRAGGPVLDKSDPWRLKYGTLWGSPVESWPEEARRYALMDAEATRAVWRAQECEQEALRDQYRQSRAAFWIALMTAWGFATDRAQAERYIQHVQRTLEEDRKLCLEVGLVRPDGTKDTKAAQAWMVQVCEEAGDPVPLTEGGAPSLSEESVEEHGDYILEAYQRYANANTRAKRAKRLLNSPIQSRFNVLVNTGRTSCSQGDGKKTKKTALEPVTAWGAQIQNPSKEKGFRESFVARPGCALVSVDYDALELHSWSQVCIWLFGYSKMAESINAGGDQHTELAAEMLKISTEEAYRLKKTDESFSSGPRFFSKQGNFGYLANMGAKKFCKTLVKQAVHQGDAATIAKAKAYTVEEAQALKDAFMAKWTESKQYFDHVSKLVNAGKPLLDANGQPVVNANGKTTKVTSITHFKSNRVRGGVYYTQLCNSYFQGLAADLAKDAMWRCGVEMYTKPTSPLYGSRIVNFVHDELLAEVPLDRLHDAAYRARDIMCATGKEWCPDLTFTAEPAAMTRWNKSAKTIFDGNGNLVPWEEKSP